MQTAETKKEHVYVVKIIHSETGRHNNRTLRRMLKWYCNNVSSQVTFTLSVIICCGHFRPKRSSLAFVLLKAPVDTGGLVTKTKE